MRNGPCVTSKGFGRRLLLQAAALGGSQKVTFTLRAEQFTIIGGSGFEDVGKYTIRIDEIDALFIYCDLIRYEDISDIKILQKILIIYITCWWILLFFR